MKKRLIAILLLACLLFSLLVPVHAVESNDELIPDYEKYSMFMKNTFPTTYSDRLYLSALDACSDLDGFIDVASEVIGENLSVERCTEILANMVTLMNYQLEDAIVEQAKVDTTKTLLDYGVDLASIAAGVVGTDDIKKGFDDVMKRIGATIGVLNGTMDFTNSTIEELELLIQLEADYSMQYDFLETVYMYADLPEMREAAQSLILANKEIMLHKLETITATGMSFAKFEAHDVFLDQVAGKLLEDPDFWDSDVYGPLLILSSLYSKYSLFKVTLDIGLFLGDTLFGTSDIYNRYNEMLAMRDIRNALLSRVNANPVSDETDYDNMDRNISLLRLSLYVDVRGEYCAYKMITEDGQLTKYFVSSNQKSVEENYQTSINIIEYSFVGLDGLYVTVDLGATDSETNDKDKRLLRIEKKTFDGKIDTVFDFTYDDKGCVSVVTGTYPETSDVFRRDYIYDDENRLIEIWHGEWLYVKYHYDEKGELVNMTGFGEGGGVYFPEKTKKDNQGRTTEKVYRYDWGTSVYEYRYNEDGSRVETIETITDHTGRVTVRKYANTYRYDEQGRLISDTRESDGSSHTTVYCYDYKLFTTEASAGELPDYYSIKDIMGHEIWALSIGTPERLEVDKNGYITRIIYIDPKPSIRNGKEYRGDAIYDFIYDDGRQLDPIPPLEQFMEQVEQGKIVITEKEAFRIACKYWGCSEDGDLKNGEYEAYIEAEFGQALRQDEKTGKYYYLYLLRSMVDGIVGDRHPVTHDILFINAETGKTGRILKEVLE